MAGNVGRADEFRLVPGASLKEEFNDNILFSSNNELSSFISTVSPKLSLIERTERLDARIDARLDFLFYTRDSHLNDVDQSYSGEAKYQLTPLFGVAGKASFDHVSRPDSYLETAGQVITQGSDRQKYSIEGNLTLSEKFSASLGYDYEQTDYDVESENDFNSHNATLGLVYDMGDLLPQLKLMGNLGFGRSDFTTMDLDQYTATVGFGYNFHELWSVQSSGGVIFTHSTFTEEEFIPPFTFSTVKRTKDDLGWLGSLTFSYRGELNSASLNFSRSVEGSYGSSGAVERTSVIMDLGTKFSYELSGHLGGGYYLNTSNKNQFSTQDIDETTYRLNASLRYEFSPDISADCYYEIAKLQDDQEGTDSLRNLVYLRLTVQHAFFE